MSVVLAHFEDIIARGLRALIEDEDSLDLVAADVPHERLASTLDKAHPQVAIVNFGTLSGPSELRGLHQRCPETRLLVLANQPSPSESRQMLSFGATACLAKSTQARDILHAIHLASRGLHVLPPGPPASRRGEPELLTPREMEILEHLQVGRSNGEIAAALQVSVETVRTHARQIYRKLGVRSRRELRQEG